MKMETRPPTACCSCDPCTVLGPKQGCQDVIISGLAFYLAAFNSRQALEPTSIAPSTVVTESTRPKLLLGVSP